MPARFKDSSQQELVLVFNIQSSLMQIQITTRTIIWILLFCSIASCKKIVDIDSPIDTITTEQVFSNNEQAEWTLGGVYSMMINGIQPNQTAERLQFSAGLAGFCGAMSADEVYPWSQNTAQEWMLSVNNLNVLNAFLPNEIWRSAYRAIYDANAIIEGVAASESDLLTDSARKQLTAEAKTIRAFSYFNLTNFYGELPLVLTIDYNQTKNLSRSPVSVIYQQIIKDLTEASADLHEDFRASNGKRTRINKWAAAALLARAYLFDGQYQNAINIATNVINRNDLYVLEPDLNLVFKENSKEIIWQLSQTRIYGESCTPDAKLWLPLFGEGFGSYTIYPGLLTAFESNDDRRTSWVAEYPNGFGQIIYMPHKYKNRSKTGITDENSVVLRLAELFLIRAEAAILLNAGNTSVAIDDLNMIRERAGLNDLPYSLTAPQVIQAVADERRKELFSEWAHRWFDLKRTGKAVEVLKQVSFKNPWKGDFQLLYPLPVNELKANFALSQNPGYEQL
ncbi:putative outer membrane starch-binding protein [Pseudobacter ginsenosidimutans]|uniref:Putative outer membrane starch-binding protein n=2 Tax=Pseudobacter ginsenosidimutans TaxID=661488 RepID=A0A4Q7N2H9_9BACT|nr:RagB/SusD family nutrient uptake outer membrane protein [Pseudobacter ginsenosidimutans]RZS74175.1 putative outer membrane starch-binding protein [Pseudobacter ginsenosidimutans]